MRQTKWTIALLLTICGSMTFALGPTTTPVPPVDDDPDRLPLKGEPVDASANRMGGAARGSEVPGDTPRVFLFASQTTGLTNRTQPTIYYYLTRDTNLDVEVVVADTRKPKPVYKRTVADLKKGIQTIDLAKQNVTLEPGAQYKLTVIINPAEPAKAFYASAWLKVDPTVNAGDKPDQFAYAKAGLWYDTMDAVCRAIDANPKDAKLRRQRMSLFDQAHVFFNDPRLATSGAVTTDPAKLNEAVTKAQADEKQLLKELADMDAAAMK